MWFSWNDVWCAQLRFPGQESQARMSIGGGIGNTAPIRKPDSPCRHHAQNTPDNLPLVSAPPKDICHVKVAVSGEKALRIATSAEPPDLILFDTMNPGCHHAGHGRAGRDPYANECQPSVPPD
jgi:CheY-like chemotaxis protein